MMKTTVYGGTTVSFILLSGASVFRVVGEVCKVARLVWAGILKYTAKYANFIQRLSSNVLTASVRLNPTHSLPL